MIIQHADVVSEGHGWLFVGIYDGFNGPDAPDFLMGNLYKSVYNELEGLFWDSGETCPEDGVKLSSEDAPDRGSVKKVTFQPEQTEVRRRRLWEFLAEDDPEDGLDLSGSDRFAFSVDDALGLSNASSAVSRRLLLLSKLKHGLIKHKESGKLFPWRFGLEAKEKSEADNRVDERTSKSGRKRKIGPVDHDLVLDQNPELALMGSCLLAVLMRDEDVYVMNVGDSRAIVAQYEPEEISTSTEVKGLVDDELNAEDIVEESSDAGERVNLVPNEVFAQAMLLTALQLSTDHSRSIEEVSVEFWKILN
ncbi:[pyruvate dehydrogenase (acetyl-transferring)]-phosphatase [Sarracenia purpurea var. burkii]